MDHSTMDNSDEDDFLIEQDKKKNSIKYWDIFQILPPDVDSDLAEDQIIYNGIIKSMKVLAYLITFAVALTCGVFSKGMTTLMTSQLKPNRTITYCNANFGEDRQFIAHSTINERISWYWAILFAFMVPEIFVFFRSIRIWIFKGVTFPTKVQLLLPIIFETLHTIGMGLMVYTVLPSMDVIKATMITNGVCIIPAVFGMLSRGYDDNWIIKCVVDVFAIVAQISALFVWPLFSPQGEDNKPWLLPIAAFLISFGWWENFVDTDSPFGFIKRLGEMKRDLEASRYFTYTFVSLWKISIFLGTMSLSFFINEDSLSPLFDDFYPAFQRHGFESEEKRPPIIASVNPETPENITMQPRIPELNYPDTVIYVMFTQILSTYLCYIFAKYACKICIQSFSFSFPILLIVPTTITVAVSLCGMRQTKTCFWEDLFPGYFFWTCPSGDFWNDFFVKENAWIWILWLLSQVWVSLHIWKPTSERLASSERLFITPYYSSLMLEQSMALNRRRDIRHYKTDEEAGAPVVDPESEEYDVRREDEVPRLIGCATMWHENKEEMVEMLKSIFRMDADQCARRIALKYFEVADPGYYEFETNIFFDDAFMPVAVPSGQDKNFEYQINSFVRTFLGTIEEAASHVHQSFIKLKPPKKIPTPYGGRLIYTLPGKTKLIVHIKDKNKIRHRKRWSQVMYMYYLLGHKLMDMPISTARKEVIAENTYLLALDGDIDFQPNAVEFLVDLMKKNKNLGAACGRIHPTGEGPMVWYQKFEYATGHWLQKAAEHVIGCVLCSPGCFSLFRGKALMDDNVMKKYTTMSEEPRHYVQYDQGEDRWLCTLLLQRGYRVEYSAASDAKTHAPEGFNEFFNQRRRWVPSTMANIFDLLMDYKKTVKVNPDISTPYIFYQMGLMVGSILGPGTIFLMMVGAFVAAFKIGQWESFGYNFAPIFIFAVVCYFCKADTQLTVAQILSAAYALVMVAVIVAIALQIVDDGLLAPSSIFLVIVASSFVIAGLLHPMEFGCLPHGIIYYMTIPSMYLLLIIYSLFNLNNVTWGTREGPQTKTKDELAAEALEKEEEKNRKKNGLFFGLLPNQKKDPNDTEGSVEFSFAGLFKIMCCISTKPNDDKKQLLRIADALEKVTNRLDIIERSLEISALSSNMSTTSGRRVSSFGVGSMRQMDPVVEEHATSSVENDADAPKEIRVKRDDLMNPYWLEDRDLRKGEVDFLTGPEIKFWQELIEKYLKPIDADKKKELELAAQLIDLRNKSVFAFTMFNAIFVILVFLLQLEKETIHINWPLGAKSNVTYISGTAQVEVAVEYLELEPIGLVFVGFFGFVLGVQFVAMLFHRFGTLTQILAVTEINWCSKDTNTLTKEAAAAKQGIGLIRRLQKFSPEEEGNGSVATTTLKDAAGRRKTIHNLEKQVHAAEKPIHNLEKQALKNFESFALNAGRRNTRMLKSDKANSTFEALQGRRSIVLEKRKSVVELERRRSQAFSNPLASRTSASPSTSSSMQQDIPPSRFLKQSEKRKPPFNTQSSLISDNDVEMNDMRSTPRR